MSALTWAASAPLRGIPVAEQTLPALLERQAAAYGEKPLLRFGEDVRSYAEVAQGAARAAAVLAEAGVEPGDRVALLAGNRVELLETVLGCAWLGAVAVPLNTALRAASLQHTLVNSEARLLITEAGLLERLAAVEETGALERVWVLARTGAEAGEPLPARAGGVEVAPAPPLTGDGPPLPRSGVGPGTTAAILYTSGTTGLSKGVQCPQAQFFHWGIVMGELLELTEDDVLYTCLPLFHTNAINAFVQALVAGATFVVGERFSASRFWDTVAANDATVTYLLGAMINILWGRPATAADRRHRVRIALSPATPTSLLEPFRERFGVQLIEAYGSTETNATIGAPADQQRPGFMGVALRDFEVGVVDENDAPVPDGSAGELVLRARHPYAFATGYFAMPEATVTAWRNLWFHTGDRVVRDPDGWIRFVDRLKDAIRRRGENISSYEVERALLEHPDVSAAAVFAVPSEMAEDEVMAAIVLADGASADPVALTQHLEPRLAYFAIPRFVEFVAELPLTENGKVRKQVLRDAGVRPSTWDREAAGYVLAR
ncbi:MAG: AMP-dependent synthetase and ligase [Conexibacter sp.]|nr:AMP-dependent synthetase and ligase [Conexibacter sp.]